MNTRSFNFLALAITLLVTILSPLCAQATFSDYWFWIGWDTNCAIPICHADLGLGTGWCDSGPGASPTLADGHTPGFGYVHSQTNPGQGFIWKWDTCPFCVESACSNVKTSTTNNATSDYSDQQPKIIWQFDCNGFTNKPPSDDHDGPGAGGGGGGGAGGGGGGDGKCPDCGGGCDDDPNDGQGMCVWRVSEPYVSLWLRDEPLGYKPAVGSRVSLKLAFKQRENYGGRDPSIFGTGQRWNLSWLSYVRLDISGHSVVHFPSGIEATFLGSQDYLSNTRLAGTTASGFTVTFPSGSTNIYGLVVTNGAGQFVKAFLTKIVNASGQATTFNYSVNTNAPSPVVRLQTVVDGDGRTNTIFYVSANSYSTNLISYVVDPFNRTNSFGYDGSHLTNIVDVQGIQSSFTYSQDLVSTLTTPYGTTSFTIIDPGNPLPNGRSVLITQPDGGHQLYLYTNGAPGIASSYSSGSVPNTYPFANTLDNAELNIRNTFYWGPRQYANLSTTTISGFTAADFAKARMKHWLKEDNFVSTIGSTISMEREPSPDAAGSIEGQKTWYDYGGKTNAQYQGTQILPVLVARVLPDGTTSFTRTDRNSLGMVTTNISTYSVSGTVLLRTNISTYSADGTDLLTVTNALGVQVSSNIYNVYHQVLTNYNALGEATAYAYSASHELISTIRPTGLIATNIYDGNGLLVTTFDYEVISGSPVYYRTNSYTYTNNLIYTHTDERGLITTNLYDNLQRLTNSSDSRGAVKYIYANLDLVQTIDRMSFTNSFGYDSLRRKIAETNALGYYTISTYCTCGSLDSVRDMAGNTNYFFYDNAGRLTITVYVDGFSTTNNLNLLGQITNTIDSAGYSVTNWFNNQGRQYASTTIAGDLQYLDFDILDRITNSVDSEGISTSVTYDDLGRARSRTYPDSGIEKFGYSPRGLTAYTNQIGLTNFLTYDALGRKTFETNANNEVIRYTNSPAGDLLSFTDGKGQTTRWNYDQHGHATNKVDQLGIEILRYTYDLDDRLTNRWSPAKGNTRYSYDPIGNLLTINYPVSPSVAFAYDALNHLTNMVDGIGTTKFTYTPAGQLLTEDGPFANDAITNAYFNRLRTKFSLQQPTGVWTNSLVYDSTKRLTNVTSPAGAFTYIYDANLFTHHPSRIALPNTAYITNVFDGNARLLGTYLKNSGNSILDSYAYIYNPANQPTNFVPAHGSPAAYVYDKIGQLKTANNSIGWQYYAYSYDAARNVTSRTNNGVLQTFTVNTKNQVTNDSVWGALTYDSNGNLVSSSGGTVAYWYDDDDRFTAIESIENWRTELTYDGFGRMRRRLESHWTSDTGGGWTTDSDTYYFYDGMRAIQERDASNTPTVSYTRGNDLSGTLEDAGGIGGLLARSHNYSGGNWTTHNFYFADANGNIGYMIDSNQVMVASYGYDPFGSGCCYGDGILFDDNIYRFSSKEVLVNSGLSYYGYRLYDPNLQKWINRDPIGERGGANLYTFVGNSPTFETDALGLTAHLWPLNDVIYNWSSHDAYISGDWVDVTFYTPTFGSATSRPWSYLQLSSILNHVPNGTTITITEPIGSHTLGPGHNSETDWKNGLTKIVDADFLTGASVPVYEDVLCRKPVNGKRVKTGWTLLMSVHDCPNNCPGVFFEGGRVE